MKYMECQHDCNCPHIPPLAATTSARKRTRTRTTTAATAAGAEAAGSSKYGDVQQEVLKHDATACLCTVWYSMVRTAWYSRSMVVPLLKSFQLITVPTRSNTLVFTLASFKTLNTVDKSCFCWIHWMNHWRFFSEAGTAGTRRTL